MAARSEPVVVVPRRWAVDDRAGGEFVPDRLARCGSGGPLPADQWGAQPISDLRLVRRTSTCVG